MLTASALFKQTLKHSHRALTRVTLLAPQAGGGFTDAATLYVTSGTLRIDGTRNVWRSGNFKLAPQDSTDVDLLLDIDSTYRLRLERGIYYADGTQEWVQIGLLQIQETKIDIAHGYADVSANDLGSLIEDYDLITPYAPLDMSGNALTTINAIKDLVGAAEVWDTIPGWVVDPSLSTTATPVAGTVFTGSRWNAIKKLAESIGAVVSVTPTGYWHIRSATVDMDNPVATYAAGNGGVLVDYTRVRSRSEQYNAIPLNWESPMGGGLVFMVDADPTSPTYWDGPFGRRPRAAETNSLVTTLTQAQAAATALLDQYRGRALSLDFTAVHDPLLEPFDVITVSARGLSQVHVVDSISYPLAGGRMTVSTRLLREA